MSKMAEGTTPQPFAKEKPRLLSLDDVPRKRRVLPPVLNQENPLVPPPGTPAFADRRDQYAADTATELKHAQEAQRRQKQVFESSIASTRIGISLQRLEVRMSFKFMRFAGAHGPKKAEQSGN